MKVFIIYSSECRREVEAIRQDIATRFGERSILRMSSFGRPSRKGLRFPHRWHHLAARMLRIADMVVYVVSEHSAENPNVKWEIKKAMSYGKYMVCLKSSDVAKIDEILCRQEINAKGQTCLVDIVNRKDDIYSIIENFNNDAYIELINKNFDVNILLEQYKIFTESAESLVTRRQNMNGLYISANTALITIGATVIALSADNSLISKLGIILALSVPGILLNISWLKMLRSYYVNNRGKMKVISMMEKHLAASLYDAEWKAMKNKYSRERYISFTESEKKLPFVFVVFYSIADIVVGTILLSMLPILHFP